ncbi:DinB family protein [Pseudonocardia spinosispora]|uniref:DinB family protein n=1 Tax=Pseudonocardia spinosispora TaxID=103441 RepID=UPI0004129281|nr:DinB family protein [Pseudonocardia spinosispora]
MWRDQLVAQLDFYWDHSLTPRLDGLTDEEFRWEPVDGCWTVRTVPDGDPVIDWEWPTPDPAPVTTIAWRLAHMAIGCFGIRASSHFGDGSLTLETARWPATAAEALTALRTHHRAWRDGIGSLDDDALLRPVGPAEGPWAEHPMAALVLHLNREIMHHGAEVALLRDLYRAGYQR